MNYPKVFGTYYTIIGWLGAAGIVVSIVLAFFTDGLNLDFSFIIWLLLGSGLRRASSTARKWAIGISAFFTLMMLAFVSFGIGNAHIGNIRFEPPDVRYYLICGALFVLIGIPGLLLLRPQARKQFGPASEQTAAGSDGRADQV